MQGTGLGAWELVENDEVDDLFLNKHRMYLADPRWSKPMELGLRTPSMGS